MSLAIVTFMVLMSWSAFSITAPAEDITGPFVTRNSGYPLTYVPALDQSCEDAVDFYTVSGASPWAQTFKATKSGELSIVELQLYYDSPITTSVRCEIRGTTAGVPDPTWLTYEGDTQTLTVTPDWYQITLSNPPTLVAGETYAIVLKATGLEYHWSCLGTYADGDGFSTLDDGNTWTPSGGENFGFRTYIDVPTGGIKKAAWHSSGEFALGVTGTDENVYKYDRNAGVWNPYLNLNAGEVMHDIVFDPQPGWDLFYMVGEDTNTAEPLAYEYYYDPGGSSTLQPRTYPGTDGVFYGVERSNNGVSNYKFLAVGKNRGTGQALMAWYDFSSGWKHVMSGLGTGDTLYDACWDRDLNYYAVGQDGLGFGVVYKCDIGSTSTAKLCGGGSWPVSALYAIDWNDNNTGHDWGIMVGDNSGTGNIWKFDGTEPAALYNSANDVYYDLDFFPSGPYYGRCHVVGMGEGASGVMCSIDPVTLNVARLTVSDYSCRGIALKGPSSPSSGIITGSGEAIGFYPSAMNQDTVITVNAVIPRLHSIDFIDIGSVSHLDEQVPVDSWYNFTCVANYSQGWNNCVVEVRAWHDGGAVPGAYPTESPDNRNLAFRAYYWPGNGTYELMFPTPSLEIITGTEVDNPLGVNPGVEDHHQVFLPVKFGSQLRWADGDGWGTGDPDTFNQDINPALQDPNSWNFNVTIRDVNNPTATNVSYGEFGIHKTVAVTVSGNPSASAPPGTVDTPMSVPSHIVYSSNTDYWVNISIEHLYENGVYGATNRIGAENVSVQNTHLSADGTNSYIATTPMYFPATESEPLNVWGLNATALAPAGNGTVSAGPWVTDFNEGGGYDAYTEVIWRVTIWASVPEGVYIASVLVTVDS